MQVFVTGARGFVGTNTVRALVDAGHSVVGLVRKPVPPEKTPADVTYVSGDVREAASLSGIDFGAIDAIVHLVGIIAEVRSENQTFDAIHVEGTRNVVDSAKAAGFSGRFVYVSALGASADSRSEYARTKAAAEKIVAESGLPFTIFRPSVLLGPDGEFVAQMRDLIVKPPLAPFAPPFVPVPGSGNNRFQPVWIGDLTRCIVGSLSDPATAGKTFEIGGATQVTFNALLEAFQRRIGVKKPLLHAPMPLMFGAASVLESLLPRPPITTDQLLNLQQDNICDNGPVTAAFGFAPLPFEQTLDRVFSDQPPPRQ